MKFYEGYQYNEGQALFDRTLSGIRFAAILLIRVIVYLPLLVTAWIIAAQILNKSDNIFLWIALILLFTNLLYFVIYFIKGILIALKHHGNWLWVPLFAGCLLFACALPVYIAFNPLLKITAYLVEGNNKLLAWIFSVAFGLYVYSRYHFLTNIAPRAAYPFYQMGINVTGQLFRLTTKLKGRKSPILI